ncbi:MAG: hypothetical protein JWN86_1022 [Planctomycetota bacterium]|nr:hypothetical protein [Planctomycetota bacterium]
MKGRRSHVRKRRAVGPRARHPRFLHDPAPARIWLRCAIFIGARGVPFQEAWLGNVVADVPRSSRHTVCRSSDPHENRPARSFRVTSCRDRPEERLATSEEVMRIYPGQRPTRCIDRTHHSTHSARTTIAVHCKASTLRVGPAPIRSGRFGPDCETVRGLLASSDSLSRTSLALRLQRGSVGHRREAKIHRCIPPLQENACRRGIRGRTRALTRGHR